MKKVCLIITGILLTVSISAQTSFKVEKKFVVVDGVESEIESDLTHISFILKSKPHNSFVKIIVENRDFGINLIQ